MPPDEYTTITGSEETFTQLTSVMTEYDCNSHR